METMAFVLAFPAFVMAITAVVTTGGLTRRVRDLERELEQLRSKQ